MSSNSHSPIFLAGQTGCGKTSVALALAAQLGNVEIVNADAYQIYRGLEILSAAPTAEERAVCPHHLFGILDTAEVSDAAAFAKRARALIDTISRRAIPLVVGGSGLYLKAVTHGLAPTPKSDVALRSSFEKRSLESLVEEYQRLDPVGAKTTNLQNRRYVTRNLEICLLAGRPASDIKNEWERAQPEIDACYLHRDREEIYQRINQRTITMFEDGVVEEIAALTDISDTARKAIGLTEIQQLLKGEIERSECIATIQQITRRYAKRQASWFRRESAFDRVEIRSDESPGDVASRIVATLGRTPP